MGLGPEVRVFYACKSKAWMASTLMATRHATPTTKKVHKPPEPQLIPSPCQAKNNRKAKKKSETKTRKTPNPQPYLEVQGT